MKLAAAIQKREVSPVEMMDAGRAREAAKAAAVVFAEELMKLMLETLAPAS